MKPITADSREGRLLLALRRGPHEGGQLEAQLGSFGDLMRAAISRGYATYDGEIYRITEAGKAACPFRNPKAAEAAVQPEVFTMSRGSLNKEAVFVAIVEAGPAGTTRAALVERFGCTAKSVSGHLDRLVNIDGAPVARLDRGRYIAQRFIGADGLPISEIAPETASTATDDHEHLVWVTEPLATDPPAPATYPVENLDVEQITARPVIFDTELEDPDQVEFCIFSSGGFEIMSEQGTIGLSAPVLAKLRAFLGLFAEAA